VKAIRKKFLLAGLAILAAALVSEFVVRIAAPQNLSGAWRVYGRRGYMLNKNSGTARAQSGNRIVRYRFNAYHLRGGPISDAGKRVLVLGDSFTFGWLLEETNTYVHLLGTYADRDFGAHSFQFLNGGAGGWGLADSMAYLEDFGPDVSPDVVVAVLNTDDIGRAWESGLYRVCDTSNTELEALSVNRPFREWKNSLSMSPAYEWVLEHSHFVQLLRKSCIRSHRASASANSVKTNQDDRVPSSWTDPSHSAHAVILGKALFRRMNQWCRDHHAVLLVTTTGFHPVKTDPQTTDPTQLFMQNAHAFLEAEGIPFHDISPDFQAAIHFDKSPYVIPLDHHPNEEGSRLIALNMWPWLKEQLTPLAASGNPAD
jgi:hypothetical protein